MPANRQEASKLDSKVLVTGASGFIGWHLANALVARGDDVACLVRKTSNVDRLRPLGVRLVYGDVTDPASLAPAVERADPVRAERAGEFLGLWFLVSGLGTLAGPMVVGLLSGAVALSLAAAVTAGIGAAGGLFLLFFVPETLKKLSKK